MLSRLDSQAHRFEVYARQVIEPAVFPDREPLEVAVHQTADPIPYETAVRADFRPVGTGFSWGPAWSTAWFRLGGRAPERFANRPVVLRFCCGTEAVLRRDGAPVQGFDVNRDAFLLHERAAGGADIEFLVEAACNRPLGNTSFWWDAPEIQARWDGPAPGRLDRCELAVYDHEAWRLLQAFLFARDLLPLLPEDAPRAHGLVEALERTMRRIDDADVGASAAEALARLQDTLGHPPPSAVTRCFAVGHAHIDTAWLWPIRETRRKCIRSFANVLRLMERYPDFRFLCSQAQQYAWVEEDAPELFAEIAERVREGRWEPGGAMWVEPDGNVPCGEALVRQIVHGVRYWRERFGDAAPQRYLYLPDTFGYPAALPQIMAGAGLDTFITNKLSWNERNEFPHTSFRWRGLDGTEVLTHCTPGHDYNAANTPAELRRGAANEARKDRGRTSVWLQPFGYGDGGGGPTAETIERAILAGSADGLPRVELASARAFCEELHARRAALRARGEDLPAWDGELYLELHRGTYTTLAWLKRANRAAEHGLRAAEWLLFAAPVALPAGDAAEVRRRLDATWKLVLLNQFHDILPGSSIAAVYEDARRQYEEIDGARLKAVERGIAAWASCSDTTALARPMIVLNPGSTARSGVVPCDDDLAYVEDVPALGARVAERDAAPPVPPATAEGFTLSNGILEATIDEAGRVASLRHLALDRQAGARQADGTNAFLNQLVLYEDRPRSWEAWDIDPEYVQRAFPITEPADRRTVVETGPLRASIEVERRLGTASTITQRYVLEAGSPRLDVRTRIDWQERRRLLRALFPVDVRARTATYEIQFGHLERPTHRNTSWDEARFEVCAHAWADLSEHGFGVALLNDGKYGHSCDGNVLGLSLLRGPCFPDPDTDRGAHEFTYSIMPHGGAWRAAGVDREAHALNAPMLARALEPGREGMIQETWAPLEIRGPGAAGVQVAALKPAEEDDRLILRLVETHGGRADLEIDWGLPVASVEPVDLLERGLEVADLAHDAPARRTTVSLRPFQILTLAARVD